MSPKITVIVPVYNVEAYLRECLDSIVNQTLHDIQIICVNDGSPDRSRAILQEYADRDTRFEIIDKPNGGLSSARNAAYSHIKGKYTLFVDSDDWIEHDLCEKTCQKAESTGASMTAFAYQRGSGRKVLTLSPQDRMTVDEKSSLVDVPSACCKLWRSDFILRHQLLFPEGFTSEDDLVNWRAITLADKISIIPELLYHYRCNPHSISQTFGDHSLDAIPIYNMIRDYLIESGFYSDYRNIFIARKLKVWCRQYQCIPASIKPGFITAIRDSLTEDDRNFFRGASKQILPTSVRLFYEMIDGGHTAALSYHLMQAAKLPEQLVRRWIIKPLKNRKRAA